MPEDAYREVDLQGRPIPEVLRWWYLWAGRRKNILQGQNRFLHPESLRYDSGLLIFYRENQGVYSWATRPNGEDPPVYFRETRDDIPWEQDRVTLSQHMILACLLEAVITAPFGAMGVDLSQELYDEIAQTIPPVSVPSWLWCDTHVHWGNGAAMSAMAEGGSKYTLWIGARSPEAVQFLRPMLGDPGWCHTAV